MKSEKLKISSLIILSSLLPFSTLASPSTSILEPLSTQSTKYVDKYFEIDE